MNEAEREDIRFRITQLESELTNLRASLEPLGVNLKSAAIDTGYSVERIRQLAVAGKIAASKRGGQWLVDLQSVLAYVAQRGARPA